MSRLIAAAALLSAAACTDFATPNLLENPSIIAVVADPPVVAPGGTATLTAVVADATGIITVPATWSLVPAYPGVAPLGTITEGAGEAGLYTAPEVVPDRGMSIPPVDAISVTVETSVGPKTAIKAMPVLAATTTNPTITRLTVAGTEVDAAIPVAPGTYQLQIELSPAPTEDTRYAWYSPLGEIERYQSNPCDLVVADDATTGPLIVVARDGAGGVAWRAVELTVE
jgi:hypothetical protein